MLSYLEKNKSTNQEINDFLNNLFTIYNQHSNDKEDDNINALIDSDIDLKNSDFKEMFFILNKVIRDWYVDNIDNNLKEKSRPTGIKKTVVSAAGYLCAKTKYSGLTAVLK